MQPIQEEYLNTRIVLHPGSRLHRLVALLVDTWIDDLTDERIAELERMVESFRWCNAAGDRVD